MNHGSRGAPRRVHRGARSRATRVHPSITAVALLLLAVVSSGFAGVAAAGAAPSTTSATSGNAPPRPNTGKLTPTLAQQVPSRQRSLVAQPRAINVPDNTPGGLQRSRDGRLLVDLLVSDVDPATQAAIRATGAEITAVSTPAFHTITALVSPADLTKAAAVAQVTSVQEVLTPGSDVACAAAPSSFTSEGDAIHNADSARVDYGVDGTGVRVGVMSDSYNTSPNALDTDAPTDVTNGDLPGTGNPCGNTTPVVVTDDSATVNAASGTPADEGRAMAQTVHDLAPGAQLDFATASGGQTSYANNVNQLVANGADIIVDDVYYADEPFYQDGPVAVAVNNARAAGVSYFSSAGNSTIVQAGRSVGSYEALSYRGATCPTLPSAYADCHDYDPGAGTDTDRGLTVANNGTLPIDLQWAQPWGNVTTDYDLFLLDSSGNVLAQSTNDNSSTQRPFEYINWQNTTGSAEAVRIVVARESGTGVRFKHLVLGGSSSGLSNFEYTTSTATDIIGPSIFGHHGAQNDFSVAAVPYSNTTQAESYSAQGPMTLLFNAVPSTTALASPVVVNKPDFAAIDCVQNSFFGGGSPHRFCGTSDAAPHAAAIAALVQEARANTGQAALSPADLGTLLRTTAVPVGTEPALTVGAGLLDADGAVGTVVGATTTALASSANPSVVGQTVTYTATVSPKSGPSISTGTVNFTSDGTTITGCGSRPVASGTTTCVTTFPHATSHSIVASYTDGTTYLASSSDPLNQVINKAPTATALTSVPNPSAFGQDVTFTAHVTVPPPGAGHPSGAVTFFIGSSPVYVASLDAGTGLATFTTSAIGPPGALVHAAYSGDADFLDSTSSDVNQVVTCDHTVTGNVGSVVAGTGSTCLINAHVTGSVTTTAAGSLAVINSTVTGSVTDNTGAALRVCGSTVGNAIAAQNAKGLVVVGDPAIGCAANSVGHAMTFVNDHAGLMVIGNTYHTSLVVVNASGPGPLPSDTGPVVSGNTKV